MNSKIFLFALFLVAGLFFAQSAQSVELRVIAVDSGPAGLSTPSVAGVTIWVRDPSNGQVIASGVTTTSGVQFVLPLNRSFYVTTTGATGGAVGGTYGFYQELSGGGVPTFRIERTGSSSYRLCRLSNNECSSNIHIILYRLRGAPTGTSGSTSGGSSSPSSTSTTIDVRVITVDTGPAGTSTPSNTGVSVYARDPSNGALVDSGVTTSTGVRLTVQLNRSFYVTTAGPSGGATGGVYGFYQELSGGGVPSFRIEQSGSTYRLCKVSNNECSPYIHLILYRLRNRSTSTTIPGTTPAPTTTPTSNATTSTTCSDSDGSNIYNRGTATGLDYYGRERLTISDGCAAVSSGAETSSGPYVIENECLADNRVNAQYYACPSGYSCSNGACVRTSQPTSTNATPTCTYVQGGNNIYVKGVLNVWTPTWGSQTVSDYCVNSNGSRQEGSTYVEKLVCLNNDPTYAYTHNRVPCPSGYSCQDGACVQTSQPSTSTSGEESVNVKVIAVGAGPAGISTPSVSGVAIYMKDPSNGLTLRSGTTTADGVQFSINVSKQFYVTTVAAGALGGEYGFHQELSGGGVPSFVVRRSGSSYQLCRVSNNECSPYLHLILYRIRNRASITTPTTQPTPTTNVSSPTEPTTNISSTPPPSTMPPVSIVRLRVITVNSGPAGYDTSSVQGVKVYLRDPTTGETWKSDITNEQGVSFALESGRPFYITTAGASGSAVGGEYGFYQELSGGGVPSFRIDLTSAGYALCRISTGECSYGEPLLILYRLRAGTTVTTTPSDRPPLPEEPQYALKLTKGWNLLSLPTTKAVILENGCSASKIYLYGADRREYEVRSAREGTDLELGYRGFWIRAAEPCKMVFKPYRLYSSERMTGHRLVPAWNLLAAPTDPVRFSSISGSCTVTGGPWSYDSEAREWRRASVFQEGKGYFVRVKSECKLGISDLPPLPEG